MEFEGKLPDINMADDLHDPGEFGDSLVDALYKHHAQTGIHIVDGTLNGHKSFDAFLNDGSVAVLEVRSHFITFERRKERE